MIGEEVFDDIRWSNIFICKQESWLTILAHPAKIMADIGEIFWHLGCRPVRWCKYKFFFQIDTIFTTLSAWKMGCFAKAIFYLLRTQLISDEIRWWYLLLVILYSYCCVHSVEQYLVRVLLFIFQKEEEKSPEPAPPPPVNISTFTISHKKTSSCNIFKETLKNNDILPNSIILYNFHVFFGLLKTIYLFQPWGLSSDIWKKCKTYWPKG